jgi:hypothetical protein
MDGVGTFVGHQLRGGIFDRGREVKPAFDTSSRMFVGLA